MAECIERERLIELLNKKYDHFCDQCGVNKDSRYTEDLADYLLENGVIAPPLKVGDTVWVKEMGSGKIKECKISRIRALITEKARTYEMVAENLRRPITISFMFTEKDIGHEVFLTKKEAKEEK